MERAFLSDLATQPGRQRKRLPRLPLHADQHRPNGPVLLAVDQEFAEGPQPSDVAGSSAWTTIHGIAAYGITVTNSGQVESTVLAKPINPNPIRNKTIIAANRRRSDTRSS